MGTRQRSKLPIREEKKVSETLTRSSTDKKPQDLEQLSTKKTSFEIKKHLRPQLNDPLTPLHRLRKFKAIRDRNLLRASSTRKKIENNKMSVDIQKEGTEASKSTKEIKTVQEKVEKITNGDKQNGLNESNANEHVPECTELKITAVETNGEVENSIKNDVPEKVESEKPGSEKQLIIDENKEETVLDDVNNEEVAENVHEVNDDEQNEEPVAGTTPVTDVDNDSDNESFVDGQEEQMKILRCNLKEKMDDHYSKPSTSSAPNDIQTRTTNYEESTDKQKPSVSSDARRRMRSNRIEGRRSLWQTRAAGCRKRKYGGYFENECNEKKQAIESEMTGSPSVLSPGWKFISSPFSRFWTPQRTPSLCTPYKSITSSYQQDIEDSMSVNFDDKSLFINLNDSELGTISDSSSQSSNSKGWRCNIM